MARVSTYLNFGGNAEEAFRFYADVFGTERSTPVVRMSEMPTDPSSPPLTDDEKQLVMHVELPILAGHVLMATDIVPSQGRSLRVGNNVTINLEIDGRAEADRLFGRLSEGSTEGFGMLDMPWGDYWGTCLDRFSIRWMFSCRPGQA